MPMNASIRTGRLRTLRCQAGEDQRRESRSKPRRTSVPGVPELQAGIEASHEFDVSGPLLTDVGGTLGFSVLSSPGMIAMIERTAAMLVYPLLGDGRAT